MPQRNVAELAAGAVVLAVALGFLGYALANTGGLAAAGYTLHARFNAIDGLRVGSDVKLAGVKVGSVTGMHIDPQTYQAEVAFTVAADIHLPKDSSVGVDSEGLLGGKYLGLQPGGDTQMIPPGGQVTITQSSINIEQLLGKFVFSMGNLSNGQKPGGKAPDGGLQ